MNVASLELCKELYELSGWGVHAEYNSVFEVDKLWQVYVDKSNADFPSLVDTGFDTFKKYTEEYPSDLTPAYDLGYLLRKLEERKTGLTLYHVHSTMSWEAFYAGKFFEYGTDTQHWDTQADTPEDAACKLAVELFKQKILVK